MVVLRHFWGLSVDETAADLGISAGTVKSQTSAALARLARRTHAHRCHGRPGMTIDQFDLDARFAELAARIDAPDAPVADDLQRGRRRQRRQRLAIAGAVVATVAVVGSAVAVTPDLIRTDSGPDLVDRTGTPPPSPSGDPTASPTASQEGTGWQARRDTLIEYSQVLAEHLDPQGRHLEVLTEDNQNEQIGGGEGGIVSLGAKLGWSNDGEEGLGMVQVSVSNGWRNADWWCDGEGWTCRQLTADGRVRIAEQDGARRVGVEHPDGEVVVITLDPLFGNNSLVSGVGHGHQREAAGPGGVRPEAGPSRGSRAARSDGLRDVRGRRP